MQTSFVILYRKCDHCGKDENTAPSLISLLPFSLQWRWIKYRPRPLQLNHFEVWTPHDQTCHALSILAISLSRGVLTLGGLWWNFIPILCGEQQGDKYHGAPLNGALDLATEGVSHRKIEQCSLWKGKWWCRVADVYQPPSKGVAQIRFNKLYIEEKPQIRDFKLLRRDLDVR